MCIDTAEPIDLASRHALRDYWRRTNTLEHAVLAIVRTGRVMPADADADARRIAAAVLDLPAANRGLSVDGILIDADPAHAHWHVLVELDAGHRTAALVVTYPQ